MPFQVMVISDIHIHGPTDPLYHALLATIEMEMKSGDHLVLAGDIFDFLVGKQPRMNAQYAAFFSLLRVKGAAGVRISYIEGNHDFHLTTTFSGMPNLTVYPAELEIKTPSKRLYIAHGDLADRGDWGYRLLRVFFRSGFIQFVAFIFPESWVQWIGGQSSAASRHVNARLPEEYGVENLKRLRSIYRSFAADKLRAGFDAVVLGHCHDHDGVPGYMNVGFPRTHGNYVIFTEEQGLERRKLLN